MIAPIGIKRAALVIATRPLENRGKVNRWADPIEKPPCCWKRGAKSEHDNYQHQARRAMHTGVTVDHHIPTAVQGRKYLLQHIPDASPMNRDISDRERNRRTQLGLVACRHKPRLQIHLLLPTCLLATRPLRLRTLQR